jgi:hypothetical protein
VTIAISLKVNDGVVLAADSASTLTQQTPDGSVAVLNVYDNANKIVNLFKGLPLGVLTWGAGAIGPASMTTIFKDLRAMFNGQSQAPDGSSWLLDVDSYTVQSVAERVREYVYEHLYKQEFASWPQKPALGITVAGYSAGGRHAEEWLIEIEGANAPQPRLLRPAAESGFQVGGQPQAISRLVLGVDPNLGAVLQSHLGVSATEAPLAAQVLQEQLQLGVVQDAMPIKDALELAEFLVDVTIKMTRFLPGAATVGGPIELAAITKHEGFRWVRRKHYFEQSLNQREY